VLSYCAARTMAARGSGRIINVSSRGAFRGEPRAPAYAASKAGLNALSQSLAKALAAKGVYVFVVAASMTGAIVDVNGASYLRT
jgi:short-subunit dehydrogenase